MQLLTRILDDDLLEVTYKLANDLNLAWKNRKRVYICGNGGSAANALHIANDLHYGIGKLKAGKSIPGISVEALPGNIGIITCLANDEGYEKIYSNQIEVKGEKDDILIVLSGSGNSMNVINAIKVAKEKEMTTYAVTAFDGGKCKELANTTIHIKANDMQIAEDAQLIVGHLCMKWLNKLK
ncbi:SIS domain-containing protein [Synechococcus sp. HB1133]|nr:SIS domain-containing protein [Synechococcus sp. HB1133]MCB4431183.1 SIS domain-containing protein [Synechococcus sp. HBA1120]NHI80408.1 SIS domain-containing protein [Synechococcus sp. HB1133]